MRFGVLALVICLTNCRANSVHEEAVTQPVRPGTASQTPSQITLSERISMSSLCYTLLLEECKLEQRCLQTERKPCVDRVELTCAELASNRTNVTRSDADAAVRIMYDTYRDCQHLAIGTQGLAYPEPAASLMVTVANAGRVVTARDVCFAVQVAACARNSQCGVSSSRCSRAATKQCGNVPMRATSFTTVDLHRSRRWLLARTCEDALSWPSNVPKLVAAMVQAVQDATEDGFYYAARP